MAHVVPKFSAGSPFTSQASAAVIGGRLVAVSAAGTVAHAAVDSDKVVGVAGFDAANGEKVTVYPVSGGVHTLVASAAITAGARVVAAADGKVSTIGAALNPVGIALTAAGAANAPIDVLFI